MTRPAFHGYRRPDGCFGIRNHVAVISAMDNVNPVVRKIAAGLRGVLPIWAAYGRGMFGDDAQQHFQTLVGYGTHPNVAAVLVVSMEPWAIYGVLMILSVFPQARFADGSPHSPGRLIGAVTWCEACSRRCRACSSSSGLIEGSESASSTAWANR